jgi:chromosome segregation protein
MLRFEKLFIQGFKSFNDPTEVLFDDEGITAVVGPNGCGKSNISDAISWVIGSQSAKSLRGAKMEDVIFSGTRTRPPAGMAEVILTLRVTETFEIRSEIAKPSSAEVNAALNQQEVGQDSILSTAETEPVTEAGQVENLPHTPEKAEKRKPVKKSKEISRVYHEGERINVGRRLYRTGESEYELNGRHARLRDVQDLFMGTGLGGAHYAIIEQGRIGQVLSAKPLDRRALIEEAAGVSKFKMRQHQAELKLDAAKTNLSRIHDILIEIERQTNSLKRQAQKARRFQRLKTEQRDLMRAVFVVDYRVTRSTIDDLTLRLGEVAAHEQQLGAQITALETEHDAGVQAAREAETLLNETREAAANIDLEVERARQQHTYLQQQLQALGQRSQQFARDQAAICERSDFIAQETARLRGGLQELESEINAESRALSDEEARHHTLAESDVAAETEMEEARKGLYETTTALERWRQLKRQFVESVDRANHRLNGLATERERAANQAQAASERHAELQLQFAETSSQQQTTSEQLATVTAQLETLRAQRETSQTELNQLNRQLTANEQRLRSLAELDERRTYFSEAVQLLMKPGGQFKTLGTLADFVQVTPEFEAVIETGLRDELQYVVVPSHEDAFRAIEFLKAEGGGRATFLVVPQNAEAVPPHIPETNGHRTLTTLLGLRHAFAEAFKLALPGLAHAHVVEDAQAAMQDSLRPNGNGHATVSLTKTGERIAAGRLITGGSGTEKSTGVLALKREITELTESVSALAEQVNAAESALLALNQQIAQRTGERNELDAALRQLDKRVAVEREQLQQAERERERTSTYIRVVETETAQAQSEFDEFSSKLAHATEQTTEAETAHTAAQQVVADAQNRLAELRRAAEQRTQELSRRRAEFAAKTERRRGLQNDLRRLENENSDLTNRLDRTRLETVEAEEQSAQLTSSIAALADKLQEFTAGQQHMAATLNERVNALNAVRESVETLDLQMRATRDGATNAREQRAQGEIEQAKLSSNLAYITTNCFNELGEPITDILARLERQAEPTATAVTEASEAAERQLALAHRALDAEGEEEEPAYEPTFFTVPEDFDLAAAKQRLEELKAKIDALGPINMMALQELGEAEERFVTLTAQKADIEKAIAQTQEAIAEIKRRSKERFVDAFHQINENFKQMFVELFGGGQGEMRLIDETDILESGIEIIAQPPGKRLQNVLLLSGGEKAMTAIALVMGIFKYRPSPFCLLDEVDAPLDEMNIGRFSDKIVQMSDKTQFMIITHSKKTMEAARTLYGVTMEDPGVSKMLSVKLT